MTTRDHFLAASRREFAIAKRWKACQWRIDVAASVTALAAAVVPSPNLSLALVLVAAAAMVPDKVYDELQPQLQQLWMSGTAAG